MTNATETRPECFMCGRVIPFGEIWYRVGSSPTCGACVELRAIQNLAEPANLTSEGWAEGPGAGIDRTRP